MILQTLGAIFAGIFRGVFPDFQGFCEYFYGFCSDFRQINTCEGALAPPLPTPLDLSIRLNLLFNFSKQASSVVASNFHKSCSTYHLFRFLSHDTIF